MKTTNYGGIARAIPAPNRYRKLVPALRAGFMSGGFVANGSAGLMLFAFGPCAAALEMQKQEWPASAHRAVGMEPDFFSNLTDVVLLWDGAEPLEEETP